MRSPRSFEASRLPVLLAVAVIGVILALWVATVLLARELLPGPAAWVDRFFATALAATYLGGWVVAVTLARLRRVMLFRAVGTTLTALLVIAILEVPAAGKWLHWSLVFSSLSGEGAQDYTSSYMLDSALSFRRIPNRHWTSRPQSDIERGSGLPRSLKRPITFTYDQWGYRNGWRCRRPTS